MIETNLRFPNIRWGAISAKRQTAIGGLVDLANGPRDNYFGLALMAGPRKSAPRRGDVMIFATIALFLANAACVYIARTMALERSKSPTP